MDDADKKILENALALPIGKAISQWMKKNGVEEPVIVNALVSNPTCYIDEQGIPHTGPLITCRVSIVDEEDYDDDDD